MSVFGPRVTQSGLCLRTEARLRINKLESGSLLSDWGQDNTRQDISLGEDGESVGALSSVSDSVREKQKITVPEPAFTGSG